MIPSVLSSQISRAIREYLRTTFPSTTPLFDNALDQLISEEGSVFKGPYLSLGLPFRKGIHQGEFFPEIPLGFVPHLHQAQSFERLGVSDPLSTIVATGTGSGKTECFLLPILDYCRCHADSNGIKAIIIYPMNALATDQAGRIARMINDNHSLKGRVTAGLYIGQKGETIHRVMTADSVITDREKMRLSPPDILLTNYKMLDYMLIRPSDFPLWKHNSPESSKYLVVDELHTFDGAQGPDLACLIRRLKARVSTPADYLCCIGTSATLGGEESASSLVSYAEKVFGESFDADSVITEFRQSASEFLEGTEIEYFGIPDAGVEEYLPSASMNLEEYLQFQAKLWFGEFEFNQTWRSELGKRIRQHSLFRELLGILEDSVLPLSEVLVSLSKLDSGFAESSPEFREAILMSMLSLLSHSRGSDSFSPLVHVRLQMWLRELRRLVASVSDKPRLRFADDLNEEQLRVHLPVIHCRECGATGWGGVVRKLDSRIRCDLREYYREHFSYGKDVVFVFPEDRDARDLKIPGMSYRLCTSCLRLDAGERDYCTGCGSKSLINVFIPDNTATRKGVTIASHNCPYCGGHDSLTIMGARAATLTSVIISQLMSSPFNTDRKLLTFSDSVQDAAHRAGFYAARTWRFNLRIAIQKYLVEKGDGLELSSLPGAFIEYWSGKLDPLEYVSTFIAPNMLWFQDYELMLKTGKIPDGSRLKYRVDSRIAWEIISEYCFSARIGRTLERSGSSIVSLDSSLLEKCADSLLEPLRNKVGSLRELDRKQLLVFLAGLVTHLKNRGAVLQPILNTYIETDGNTIYITQKSKAKHIPWMPNIGPRTRAPAFPTDKTKRDRFERIIARTSSRRSWYQIWSDKCFRDLNVLVTSDADAIWKIMLKGLCDAGALEARSTSAGTAWGIIPSVLRVSCSVQLYRCSRCGYIASASVSESEIWEGAPCLRSHCSGHYEPFVSADDYYGRLYSSGDVQRLYAHEHTGLLSREDREKLEREFRSPLPDLPRKPWYPNLLSSTPTLEMGIDIGDLSSLILCSVPPSRSNYLQRTGRAGRRDGNSLSLTVASGKPHDLYFFSEPLEMLAGSITPPDVFLGASAVLERQLAAYCFDRWVESGLPSGAVPPKLGQVLSGMEPKNLSKFPWNLIRFLQRNRQELLEGFALLFENELSGDSLDHLRKFITGDENMEGSLAWRILNGLISCLAERNSFKGSVRNLNSRIKKKKEEVARGQHWQEELDELLREKKAYQNLVRGMDDKITFNFFTDEGLLPNYAFPEAGVQLRSIIFRKSEKHENEKGQWETWTYEYERASSIAIRELVPECNFYAGGRKVVIDQVDMKLSDLEDWRFCDACSHMELASSGDTKTVCPVCGSTLWMDAGQKRQMIRLRQVYASTSDRGSRIADDRDERTPLFFNRQMLVDFKGGDVAGAWKLDTEDVPFGFEFLRKVTFRDINFGEMSPFEEQVSIAGKEFPRTGFKLCKSCGKVQRKNGKVKHALTCTARKKEDDSTFLTTLYLYRDFTSEAVRFLLPVSSLVASGRMINSFIAALQLGLRLRYGGAVDHLQVTTADEPAPDSVFRKKYLVLYDTVPGGTGYLKDLMKEPSRLMEVLRLSLDRMRSCKCTLDPEKDGCYSCLYAYRQSYDMQSISRDEAIRFLSEILAGESKLKQVRSLRDISINSLLESELEELFVEALSETKIGDQCFSLRKQIVNGSPGYYLKSGSFAWHIEPQVSLGSYDGVSVPSRADFVFRPALPSSDVKPIAVFTDGFAFHKNRIGLDMAQRTAIIRSGKYRVWSLSWSDISRCEENWFVDFLSVEMARSSGLLGSLLDGFEIREMDALRNGDSFEWFKKYLTEPLEESWRKYAYVQCLTRMDNSIGVDENLIFHWKEALLSTAGGIGRLFIDEIDEPAQYGRKEDGPLKMFLVAGNESIRSRSLALMRVLLLLDDRVISQNFREEWNGYLRILNLFQFLPGCTAVSAKGVEQDISAGVTPVRAAVAGVIAPVPSEWEEAMGLADPELRQLMERVRESGIDPPETGWEIIGTDGAVAGQAELVWEYSKVVLLIESQAHYLEEFQRQGWRVFTPEQAEERPVAFISALRIAAEGSE
jgi:DEAD/DEAH box helicase domain-containing protein